MKTLSGVILYTDYRVRMTVRQSRKQPDLYVEDINQSATLRFADPVIYFSMETKIVLEACAPADS